MTKIILVQEKIKKKTLHCNTLQFSLTKTYDEAIIIIYYQSLKNHLISLGIQKINSATENNQKKSGK